MTASKIVNGLSEFQGLNRAQLAARWETVVKRPPPKAASRTFLLKALSYELQCKHGRDLSKADKKILRESVSKTTGVLAKHADTSDHSNGQKKVKRKPSPRIAIISGSRLVREWNGQTYTVSVIDEGFVYRNRTWTSLSAIAKDITGAHWSGPRFFGVGKAT